MTKKILMYLGLLIGSFGVVMLFVTATNYIQLGIAIVLYPVVAYFALKTFARKPKGVPITLETHVKSGQKTLQTVSTESEPGVIDIDKRTFLKLVGATGIFFFITSLLGKRVESLFFGQALQSGINSGISASSPSANPQAGGITANGYNITEVDDGVITYYGFTNDAGSWLVMKEDTNNSSFRYAKGTSNFPSAWTSRASLKYDYYYNLF